MRVAVRGPVHKEQSLSYDIKGIVERGLAQQLPYMGSLCKEARVFLPVVMATDTHTDSK